MPFTYEDYDNFFLELLPKRGIEPQIALSQQEIDAIEIKLNRKIPLAVRAFLHRMGFYWDVFSCQHMIHDPESSFECLTSIETRSYGGVDPQNPHFLPIMERLGEIIWVVSTDDDDPPVYVCLEYEDTTYEASGHYTSFVREAKIALFSPYEQTL